MDIEVRELEAVEVRIKGRRALVDGEVRIQKDNRHQDLRWSEQEFLIPATDDSGDKITTKAQGEAWVLGQLDSQVTATVESIRTQIEQQEETEAEKAQVRAATPKAIANAAHWADLGKASS